MANDTEKRITAKMVLDSTGFNSSLQGVNNSLKNAQSELKLASSGIQVFGKDSEKLKSVQEALSKQVELHSKKVDIYKQSIEKTTLKLDENIKKRDRLKQSLDNARTAYEKAIKEYGKESDEAKKAKEEVGKLKKEHEKASKAVETNAKQVQVYETNLNKANAEMVKVQGELRKVSSELDKSNNKWINASKGLDIASKGLKSFGDKANNLGNKLAPISLAVGGIGVACTKMAMDAVESENLFDVSMGKMAEKTRKWSEEQSKALGLNAYEVRKNVATYNVMMTSMGLSTDEAYKFSTGLTQLSYDMASFYNLKPEEAFEKLKSGISGEAEPLKALGILVNDNTIKTYAYTNGIAKQGQELTEVQKVQARYGVIMQQTSKAQGDLARTMDSPTNKLRIQKAQLEQTAIELGTKLLPLLNKGLDIAKPIIDSLSKMSDAQQENILKIGMFVAVASPALKLIGSFSSGIGGIVGGISKITGAVSNATTATKGVASATGVATKGFSAMGLATKAGALALNPWVIGIGVAGAGAYALHKHLSKEAVPSIDLFNSKVKTTTQTTDTYGNKIDVASTKTVKFADSTKKAVVGFVELNKGAKKNLTDLYVNSTKITDKTAKDLTDKYKQMGEQIKKGEDEKYKERLESFKLFLDKNKNMSDKDKADALKAMKDAHNKEKAQTDGYVKQIQEILAKASKEKRALTKEEQEQINAIQEKMKTEGIKKLSKTEEESKIILGRIKDYGKRITAEQASEIIKNAEKQRQGSVDKAEKQYNQTVEQIRKMCDEDKLITKDQADKLIAEAERQKNESITKAGLMKETVVQKIKEMNEDSLKNIDETDGHIMTKWEQLKQWFANNPIIRMIKTVGGMDALAGANNWTGTNYWQGGLTYLHDAPGRNSNYELYDLPRGTRIYNHDASEDLVNKTAEQVATKVAEGMLNKFNGSNGINVVQNIYSPTPSPSEVARQTKNNLRELALNW